VCIDFICVHAFELPSLTFLFFPLQSNREFFATRSDVTNLSLSLPPFQKMTRELFSRHAILSGIQVDSEISLAAVKGKRLVFLFHNFATQAATSKRISDALAARSASSSSRVPKKPRKPHHTSSTSRCPVAPNAGIGTDPPAPGRGGISRASPAVAPAVAGRAGGAEAKPGIGATLALRYSMRTG
jgi:hypothetical protein